MGFLKVKNIVAQIKYFFGQSFNDMVYNLPLHNKLRE